MLLRKHQSKRNHSFDIALHKPMYDKKISLNGYSNPVYLNDASKFRVVSGYFTKLVTHNAFKLLRHPCKIYVRYDDKL